MPGTARPQGADSALLATTWNSLGWEGAYLYGPLSCGIGSNAYRINQYVFCISLIEMKRKHTLPKQIIKETCFLSLKASFS